MYSWTAHTVSGIGKHGISRFVSCFFHSICSMIAVERRNTRWIRKKIGSFLKELRKEKGLTQEQLAELMYVSDRTVSRWETGSNLPSLDILIRISDYYNVELSEILDGERKSGKMNKELEETVLKVADYSNDEKMKMMKKLHIFSWIGVVSFLIYLALDVTGLAGQGITEAIASFCSGLSLGMLITAVLYTSNSIYKIKAFKKRLLGKK